jgi:hypothetical protein
MNVCSHIKKGKLGSQHIALGLTQNTRHRLAARPPLDLWTLCLDGECCMIHIWKKKKKKKNSIFDN